MPAPAVDEHERVIGTEAAQRERPYHVVGVGHALPREINRRGERLEDLARLVRALERNVL